MIATSTWRFASACSVVVALAQMTGAPEGVRAQAPAVDARQYTIDRSHSALEFVARFMGLSKVRGRFSDFSGTIMFDEERPERSTVALVVSVASIDTDDDTRDDHLRSPDWFGVEQHPRITFQSRRIDRIDATHYTLHGPLTIHGITHDVAIPVRLLHGERTDAWGNWRVGFEGAVTIKRKDFGIEGSNFFNRVFDIARMGVADEILIEFTISGRVFNMERIDFSAATGKTSVGAHLLEVLQRDGLQAALQRYHALRSGAERDRWDFAPRQLNTLGYKLLQAGRVREAVAVFQLNVEAHPNVGGLYDSLGEGYAAAGDREAAIRNYEKALALSPWSTGAIEMLRWLRGTTGTTTLSGAGASTSDP